MRSTKTWADLPLGCPIRSNGGVPAVLPSLRPYPRAPWLPISDEPAGNLLATGQIAGPLLRAGMEHHWLETATGFCRHAIAYDRLAG